MFTLVDGKMFIIIWPRFGTLVSRQVSLIFNLLSFELGLQFYYPDILWKVPITLPVQMWDFITLFIKVNC